MKEIPQKVDIPGYEGVYYVTIGGEVYRYGKNKPLKHFEVGKRKNTFVTLSLNGNGCHKGVREIMKECYFHNSPLRLESKGLSTDFSYWNLELVTPSEHSARNGKKNGKSVIRIKQNDVKFYSSAADCAKDNFLSKATVCNYCNIPGRKTLDGATYMWEEDYDYDK